MDQRTSAPLSQLDSIGSPSTTRGAPAASRRKAGDTPASSAYTAGSRHSATTDDVDIGDFSSQEASAKEARRVSAQGKRPAAPLEALPEPKLLHGDTLPNEEHKLERSPEPLDLRVYISKGRKSAKPAYSSNQSDYLGFKPAQRDEQTGGGEVGGGGEDGGGEDCNGEVRDKNSNSCFIRAFCIEKCVVCMTQGDIDPSDGQSSSSLCCRRSALSKKQCGTIHSVLLLLMMRSELLLRCQARCDRSDWTVKAATAPCQPRYARLKA
jgi:hypothetical protein